MLAAETPDLYVLEREHQFGLLAGEAQLEERLAGAVQRGDVAALAGWCPAGESVRLAERLAGTGAALVRLPVPRGIDPPTQLRATGPPQGSFTPLVTTYGTVPYADVDPTWPAGISYVAMFGVMFGDAGHGALLLLGALLLRFGRPRRLLPLRHLWPFLAGAGVAGTLAGSPTASSSGPPGSFLFCG